MAVVKTNEPTPFVRSAAGPIYDSSGGAYAQRDHLSSPAFEKPHRLRPNTQSISMLSENVPGSHRSRVGLEVGTGVGA